MKPKCPKCQGYISWDFIRYHRISIARCHVCGWYAEDGMKQNRRYHETWVHDEEKMAKLQRKVNGART